MLRIEFAGSGSSPLGQLDAHREPLRPSFHGGVLSWVTADIDKVEMVNQVLDSVGDTFWTQRLTNAVASPGAVTINNAAPTTDQWNLAIVELKR